MKRRNFRRLSLIFTLWGLGFGCSNPTSGLKTDEARFLTDYGKKIQTLPVQNKTLQFAWSGNPEKRPILFVHGSPGSWEGWVHFLLDPDLQQNFQLIAVDRPGYGGSNPGVTEPSLKAQSAQIIEALSMNHSHLPAILVGHSFGGPVIAQMAMDYPKQVAGLLFVASSVSPDLEEKKWFQYPAAWWPIREIIPTELRVCNEEIMPLKNELIRMLPDWKLISAKVVIIQGEKDDLVPPANLAFLVHHLRANQIIKVFDIPDMNHFVPWMRPDLIFSGIKLLNEHF